MSAHERQPTQRKRLQRTTNYLDLRASESPSAHRPTSPARYVNLEPDEPPAAEGPSPREADNKLELLRGLLAVERRRNEQRRRNGLSLQQLVQQLQADYLNLQRQFLANLELARQADGRRQAEIDALRSELAERDRLVNQLRADLQQPPGALEQAEQQLASERTSHAETLQQLRAQLEAAAAQLQEARDQRDRLAAEPAQVQLAQLRADKVELAGQVEELRSELEVSGAALGRNGTRAAELVLDLERLDERHRLEVGALGGQLADQRRRAAELERKLEERDELIQASQFKLRRAEERAANLIQALKAEEAAGKELAGSLELRHQEATERQAIELRQLRAKSVELEAELQRKQADLVRLELEQANQLESLRADRDCRLQRAQAERQRADKECQAAEVKLARELEAQQERAKQLEQVQREAQQFRDESKRLSIELAKSEAKLFARQQELERARQATAAQRRQAAQTERLDQSQLAELTEARRVTRRLETRCEELKLENEKLRMKLRLGEANMSRINSAINKEQAKMAHEYEKKLEQVTVEQAAYERNRLRCRKLGNKLKRYCEHLRQVHQHVCTPNECGLLIQASCRDAPPASPISKPEEADEDACDHNYYYCIDSSSL